MTAPPLSAPNRHLSPFYWDLNASRLQDNHAPAWMVESSLKYAAKLRERGR